MNIFFSSKNIELTSKNDVRLKYKALKSIKNPDISKLYINLCDYQYIKEILEENNIDYKKTVFTIKNINQLLNNIENSPMRLGRGESDIIENTFDTDILSAQLKILRSKYKKKKYKIVIINGYGSNLGDSMIGTSAMNSVSTYLKRYLDNFSIDIYLSIDANKMNKSILQSNHNIKNVSFHNLSVKDFCEYDAYFDLSNLLYLSQKIDIATIDWFIWWFGLNPSKIDLNHKRNNKVEIEKKIREEISKLFSSYKDKKKIFFNPKASTQLRSCPDDTAISIIKELLKSKDFYIVIDCDLNIDDENLINLSKDIDSAQKFTSLVSQMDAIVSVNTYSAHIADAYNIPSVIIDTSLPSLSTRYYPLASNILIPDAKNLSGWMMFKEKDAMQWNQMKNEYLKAWQKIDLSLIADELNKRIKQKENNE